MTHAVYQTTEGHRLKEASETCAAGREQERATLKKILVRLESHATLNEEERRFLNRSGLVVERVPCDDRQKHEQIATGLAREAVELAKQQGYPLVMAIPLSEAKVAYLAPGFNIQKVVVDITAQVVARFEATTRKQN
jgi:hypothetical protein